MDFDLSKENIQPLRGGRNVTQLEVALQAQNDSELQRELMQQKSAFEEAIQNYEGEDPLDNWYNYISWVEQSFPKHGHEGNLIPVLEDCLSKFENDERYTHDRRFCKLWIKYIDLQQNPLELFQLLYSKGICVSCADLYRAWAFYHEVSGDYKRADAVFQLGLRGLAQPFEELNFAYQNMFMAIGKETVQGVDERRREAERHALTSLVSYNHTQRNMVPSVRIGPNVLNPTPGPLPNSVRQDRSNAPVTLYEDLEVAGPSIGATASVSVLEVAKKQDVVHKENALKPGTWKKSIITKKVPVHHQPTFPIHEDEDLQYAGGIRLPRDFAPMNFDDFSTWKTDLFYPEPEDDTKIPMYPKHIVYGTPGIEFSIEEIRARKWLSKKQAEIEAKNISCETMQETLMEEANIMAGNPLEAAQIIHTTAHVMNFPSPTDNFASSRTSPMPQNISSCIGEANSVKLSPNQYEPRASVFQTASQEISSHYNISQNLGSQNSSYYQAQLSNVSISNLKLPQSIHSSPIYTQSQAVVSQIYSPPQESVPSQIFCQAQQTHSQMFSQPQDVVYSQPPEVIFCQSEPSNFTQSHSQQDSHFQLWTDDNSRRINHNSEVLGAAAPIQQWPNNTINSDDNFTQTSRDAMKSLNEIWKSHDHEPSLPSIPRPKPEISKFQIHEDTILAEKSPEPVAENSSSNKLHFSIYSDFENDNKRAPQPSGSNSTMGYRKLARESLRTPFTSQPLPEAEPELPRKTPSYSEPINDDFVRPAEIKPSRFSVFQDNGPTLNETCSTQQFNFHLRSDKVSTPFNYKKLAVQQYSNTALAENQEFLKTRNKKLFEDAEDVSEKDQEEIKHQTALSVILETTKEYRNSSSSGSSSNSANILKTTLFHRESLKAIPEASLIFEESITNKSKVMDQRKSILNYENLKGDIDSDVENYDMVKKWLKSDSPEQCRQSLAAPVIDLTDEDSIISKKNYRASEVGAGDAQRHQRAILVNYESPMKNQFREMSCDSSNDSSGSSAVKNHKMDVDFNSSQSSNSDFKMDQDLEPFDETILQKAPSDPFTHKIIAALLRKAGFPNAKYYKQYIQMHSFPRIIGKKEIINLMDDRYMVEKVIGKGAFGSVYKATNLNTGEMVALKYQRPPNKWEFYIIKELHERCNPYMVSAYMDVSSCYISQSASILVSKYFKYGSLLDLTNKIKKITGKGVKELISIYYASEIITIVNTLHKCNIIHADIKPDNFLVTRMPPEFGYPSLQLIDFGNSIDMSLFPKGTTFTTVVNTENFICTEMKERKPWTYQTDIFCIAATVHVLLFDKYMEVQKNGTVWEILQRIPRYMGQDLWNTFFFQMLNIEGCDKLPDLDQIKSTFDSVLSVQSENLQKELRLVANIVLGR